MLVIVNQVLGDSQHKPGQWWHQKTWLDLLKQVIAECKKEKFNLHLNQYKVML